MRFWVMFCLVLMCGFGPGTLDAKTLTKGDATFDVADEVFGAYPELIDLILATESMDDEERQYWFTLLPSMTTAQVDRLYDILETERRKLVELEKKYIGKVTALTLRRKVEEFVLQIKESFADQADATEVYSLPVLNLDLVPPVTIQKFTRFEDIPTLVLPTEQDLVDPETPDVPLKSVGALVNAAVYREMIKSQLIERQSDIVMVTYAIALAEEPEKYRAFLGQDSFKDFILLGAERAVFLGQVGIAATFHKAFPKYGIVLPSSTQSLETRVPELIQSIEDELAAPNPNVYSLIFETRKLTEFLITYACYSRCANVIESSLEAIDDKREVILDIFRKEITKPTSGYFTSALVLDYLSLFTRDDLLRQDLGELSQEMLALFEANGDRLDWEAWSWTEADSEAKFKAYIENGLKEDGTWTDLAHRIGWYGMLTEAYRSGATREVSNMLRDISHQYSSDDNINAFFALEGPLIEANTYSLVQDFLNEACFENGREMLGLLGSSLYMGREPYSTAFKYIEKEMVLAMLSPRVLQRFCFRETDIAGMTDHTFKGVVIGVSDTAPQHPGVFDPFYLGDIPRRDAMGVKAALEKGQIDWNVQPLIDEQATEIGIKDLIGELLATARSEDNILIYFSGHGHGGKARYDSDDYIMSSDGQSIALSWVYDQIRKSPAGRVLVVIDSCRNTNVPLAALKGSAASTRYTSVISQGNADLGTSAMVLMSTSAGYPASADRAAGYSYFTRHFIDALSGDAIVGDNDGVLNVQEVLSYASDQVFKQTGGQRPQQRFIKEGALDWTMNLFLSGPIKTAAQ